VHRCRGDSDRCRGHAGTEVQRCIVGAGAGAEVQTRYRYRGAVVHWCSGA